MTSTRQNQLSKDRLNRDRVEKLVRLDNPESEKPLLLADRGMPILLRPGFRANGQGKLPILRKTYVSVKSAVNRLLIENFLSLGLTFVLSKKTALTISGIHFSPLHWTQKQGKWQGDYSDGGAENGNEPLNSEYTKTPSDVL